MLKIKVGELKFDKSIYPRMEIDPQNVSYLKEADKSGASLPPIIIDGKTKIIVDGVHRWKMYLGNYGATHEIDVIEKKYKSEKDLILDAIRYNSSHGRNLTKYDRVHCILMAENSGIQYEQIASALNVTMKSLEKLRFNRVGKISFSNAKKKEIPLKRTIEHLNGQELTPKQQETNKSLGGMSQLFYVNQLKMLINDNLIDYKNKNLIDGLKELRDLLNKMKI
jgi:hypothetical protein